VQKTKVGETKYILNMLTTQYGGHIRGFLLLGDGGGNDLYVQYGFGKSNLTGYNAVATMDGIVFDYSYMRHFEGSAPYRSIGIGFVQNR